MSSPDRMKGEGETLDAFYHGRIRILQSKKGYRFAVDAPILASFIETRESDELVELGAGNGVISLLLSVKPFRRILCVEIQASLADQARRNVALNGLEGRIEVLEADLRELRSDRKFDVVFSNPPWIRGAKRPHGPSLEKAIAKHEIKSDIFAIMLKTGELLKADGRAYFIYPDRRKKDFVEAAERAGLGIRRIREVAPRERSKAGFILAECGFGAAALRVLPPLVIFDKEGRYTPEMERIFAGDASV